MTEQPKAQFFNPPHSLAKAIVGDGPARIDPNLVKQAEEAVARLKDDFPEWANEYIDDMRRAVADARANPDATGDEVSLIFTRAMDLKGQAGSYGLMMLTEIGDLLKKYTEGRSSVTERDLQIIDAHIDAMSVALRDEIDGDGGEVGTADRRQSAHLDADLTAPRPSFSSKHSGSNSLKSPSAGQSAGSSAASCA